MLICMTRAFCSIQPCIASAANRRCCSAAGACKPVGFITRPLRLSLGHWQGGSAITPAEGVLERAVQHGGANVEEGLHRHPVPAHLLLLVHALGHDLVDCALHECS